MTDEKLEPRANKKIVERGMTYRDAGRLNFQTMLAEQGERRRLTQEMHDHIVKDLVFCNLRLGLAARSESVNELSGALDEVQCLVQLILEKVRMLSSELSPALLYDLGLGEAVAELLKEMKRKHGIKYYIEDTTLEPLNDSTRVFLFQSIREMLNNVVEHAQAEAVWVYLGRRDKYAEVVVEDDGGGFDISMLREDPPPGLGLTNLRQRVEYAGGYLDIESDQEKGTRVRLVVPLRSRPG